MCRQQTSGVEDGHGRRIGGMKSMSYLYAGTKAHQDGSEPKTVKVQVLSATTNTYTK